MKIRHPTPHEPTDAIAPALAKVWVMAGGGSTAMVERDFGHVAKNYLKTSRGLTSNYLRAAERRLAEACHGPANGAYMESLAQQAQKIWATGFARPRAAGPEKRVNFSRVRPKTTATSIAGWLKRRRQNVAKATKAAAPLDPLTLKRKAKVLAGHAWSDGHDKKEQHLETLIKKRKFEAQKDGQLLRISATFVIVMSLLR